ncbi:MAG: biotin--[acetyl-CoA-carboxylase] ligase [Anaerolineales bacterium]
MLDQLTLNTLKDELNLGRAEYFPSIPSTNDTALEWISLGCPNYSVVVADKQTKGKGRSGRTWYTLPDSGLAFSFIITEPTQKINLLAGVAALAVYDAVSKFVSADVEIKWPNDILIQKKKVCGILVESQWAGNQVQGIVLGIGINITSKSLNFEEKIRYPASFLERFAKEIIRRDDLFKDILANLIFWDKERTSQEVISAWNQRLAFLGEQITAVRNENNSITGKLLAISDEGNILIKLHSGEVLEYTANEIQVNI